MECLINKKLVARLYSESDGQCLDVWMENGDKWCPSGVSTGTSTFINNIDIGIKCILSKFTDDKKLCGEVCMSQGWDASQKPRKA